MSELVPVSPNKKSDGTADVDLETGAVPDRKAPNAKLTDLGVLRIKQMIVSGYDNAQIVNRLIEEGHVLSYTEAAVSYWRKRPDVIALLGRRDTEALQSGLAAKERRVKELAEMAQLLKEDLTEIDPLTGRLRIKSGPNVNRLAQGTLVREFRETIKDIGDLVDDKKGPEVQINASVTQNNINLQRVGIEVSGGVSLAERLKQAAQIIDAEIIDAEELPASIGGPGA